MIHPFLRLIPTAKKEKRSRDPSHPAKMSVGREQWSLRTLNTITVTLALGLIALAGWHAQNPAHFGLAEVPRPPPDPVSLGTPAPATGYAAECWRGSCAASARHAMCAMRLANQVCMLFD